MYFRPKYFEREKFSTISVPSNTAGAVKHGAFRPTSDVGALISQQQPQLQQLQSQLSPQPQLLFFSQFTSSMMFMF
jgi:hypothetical protein